MSSFYSGPHLSDGPDSGWKNVPEKFGNLWIILFLCNAAGQFSTASCFRLFFVIDKIWN
jgi:hypothetical protein